MNAKSIFQCNHGNSWLFRNWLSEASALWVYFSSWRKNKLARQTKYSRVTESNHVFSRNWFHQRRFRVAQRFWVDAGSMSALPVRYRANVSGLTKPGWFQNISHWDMGPISLTIFQCWSKLTGKFILVKSIHFLCITSMQIVNRSRSKQNFTGIWTGMDK